MKLIRFLSVYNCTVFCCIFNEYYLYFLGDLESELEKVASDRTDCQESLAKAESLILDGNSDKKSLQKEHDKLTEEKKNLQVQVDDLSSDLVALRKELLQMEQDKQELEVDRSNVTDKWKAVSLEKEKVLKYS